MHRVLRKPLTTIQTKSDITKYLDIRIGSIVSDVKQALSEKRSHCLYNINDTQRYNPNQGKNVKGLIRISFFDSIMQKVELYRYLCGNIRFPA